MLVEVESLLAKIALGDRQAFDALYEDTCARLYGIAFAIIKDDVEAEEALQDAYLQVWRRAASFNRSQGTASVWLASVTRNAAIDRLRKGRNRREQQLDWEDTLETRAPSPEALAAVSTDTQRLHDCLRQLEPERARLLRKAYLKGLTHAELAKSTKKPIGTIKSWIRRSLLKLRECLEPLRETGE